RSPDELYAHLSAQQRKPMSGSWVSRTSVPLVPHALSPELPPLDAAPPPRTWHWLVTSTPLQASSHSPTLPLMSKRASNGALSPLQSGMVRTSLGGVEWGCASQHFPPAHGFP